MDTALQSSSKTSWSPFSLFHDLEFHAAADGLGHPEGAAETFHFEGLLGCFPGFEAGFKGVGGVGEGEGGGGDGGADAHAKGVVEAGGGGGAGVEGCEVGVGC